MEKVLYKGKILRDSLLNRCNMADEIEWISGYYYKLEQGDSHSGERVEHIILADSYYKEEYNGYAYEVIPETVSEYIGIDDDEYGAMIFNRDVVMVEFDKEEDMIKPNGEPLIGFVTYQYGTYVIVESWSCATEFNPNYRYTNLGSIYSPINKEYLERYKEWKALIC